MPAAPKSGLGVLVICICFLYGCAGSQTNQDHNGIADMVGEGDLDLLFATEFPVASKEEAIAESKLAYRDGDLDKALFYSVKALKFDPSDLELLVRIANLHELQGNSQMAARAFNFALERDPAHPEALQGLGLLYFEAGHKEQAQHKLELAVAGDTGLWRSYNILGVLADDRGDYAIAADYYEKALAIQPDSASVLINRGYSKYLAGDLHEAAVDFSVVAARSDNAKAWRNLGMVYAKLGWYDAALKIFRKVEDEAGAYNRTGVIALENQDLDVAYDFFSAALRHSPVYFAEAEQNLEQVRDRRGVTARY